MTKSDRFSRRSGQRESKMLDQIIALAAMESAFIIHTFNQITLYARKCRERVLTKGIEVPNKEVKYGK